MNRKKALFLPGLLILAILACNAPSQQANPSSNGAALTITALAATIQAQNGQPQGNLASANTPTITPEPSITPSLTNTPTPTDTPTTTLTPTVTLTTTPTVPLVSVSQNTNCRTGPGTQYDYIDALNIGQTAEVVGKFTSGNYWIIKRTSGSGTCWLWGQYATVTGNIAALPEMPQPPTPTPSLPAAPKAVSANITCTLSGLPLLHQNVHVDLHWTDVATNEDGYHIYRKGELLATLGANTTSFSDATTLPALFILGDPPPSVTYGIEAFNAAGVSVKKEKTLSCP